MKKTKIIKFAILAVCIHLFVLMANANEDNLTVKHTIDSKFPVEKRTITVRLPKSYNKNKNQRYPVLYLLDGQSNLEFSNSVVRFLTESGSMPEIIIAAMHSNQTRSRDYLPPNADKRFSGNASQYLKHIEQELIPFINEKYRAAGFKILSGHSFGGVFATYAMLEKPEIFNAYIAHSPYFNKQIGAPIVARMLKLFADNPQLKGFYYMNLGSEPELKENFTKIKNVFESDAPKTFVWNSEILPQKTHMTTRFIGQYNALEDLFVEDWTFSPEEIRKEKFAGFKMRIDNLSKKYGYQVYLSQRHFIQSTQVFLSMRDRESAIKTAELFVSQYPDSIIGHFLLAVGHGAQERSRALGAIEKAIKLFENASEPKSKALYSRLMQFRKQLNAN